MVGIPTQEKDPRHPQVCGKGTDLEGGAGAAAVLLESPGPCPPGLYQGLKNSTGTRVGRQGLGKSPLPAGDAAHCLTAAFCLLPGLREGVPVKGSGPTSKRAGRGRDRSGGPPPKLGSCQPPLRGGTAGDRDPEESEANC